VKHALIIAGSRGLGFGLVREYLARGWHVTATARTPSDELVALHRDAAERLVIESLDVTVVAQAAALAVRLNGQSFDLLFLNPGIMAGSGAALSDVPDGDIQNLFSPTLSARSEWPTHWHTSSFLAEPLLSCLPKGVLSAPTMGRGQSCIVPARQR
jgi:NAD(P)-dependent dehydrogenase (short-subunit alcohol dehydrogenase family)